MEYQKIINLLDNTTNHPSKFNTKTVEITGESCGTYNKDNQIRLKILLLRSSLFDYSNAYIDVNGTITVENKATQYQPNNDANKKVMCKYFRSFTNSIIRINNT